MNATRFLGRRMHTARKRAEPPHRYGSALRRRCRVIDGTATRDTAPDPPPTTAGGLRAVGGGGWVADMPWVGQVDFWDGDKDDIQFCFPEFQPYRGKCRFAGCRHHTELGCAVRAAVEKGAIDSRRYESYMQMT